MALNTNSPIPLYRQLADIIRAGIDGGEYSVESRIPSETDFARRYSIGRPTVRQATDLLVRQGRLERRRGSGTYVMPPAQSIDLFSLAGTSAALQKSELAAELELVDGPVRDADNRINVERVARVADVPVMHESLRFDAELFHALENHDLKNQSISALVRDVCFLEPTSADQTYWVLKADKAMAKLLDVKNGSPLLHVHRTLHFGEHRDAMHADILCRTDQFAFSQTLYPTQADSGNVDLHKLQTNRDKHA